MSGRWYGEPTLHALKAAIAQPTNTATRRSGTDVDATSMRATVRHLRLTPYGRNVKIR